MKKALAAIIVLAMSATVAQADVLAYYCDGTDQQADALTELASHADVTAGSLQNVGFEGDPQITRTSWGDATPAGPTAGSSAGSAWLKARLTKIPATPISTDDYFGFTVTANGGDDLDLSTLTFDLTLGSNGGAQDVRFAYNVFASKDGGAFASVASGFTAEHDSFTPGPDFLLPVETKVIDLSGLADANQYEFRIALGDDGDNESSASAFVQGIKLDGVTVVPEPATMGLLAIGGVGVLLRRRRR